MWKQKNKGVQFKELVNGVLTLENEIPNIEDLSFVNDEFNKLPELTAENEDELISIQSEPDDPLDCINEGSCCNFGDVTYAYCGKYCGYMQDAGGSNDGSDTENQLDACCYQHDYCLWENLKSRCDCHNDFLSCSNSVLKTPGYTTIRNGIRVQKVLDRCYI